MYSSQAANKSIDSQLMVNCTFDMDYLEITKNESLRKYEENVYLLGSIFANKVSESDSEEDEEISMDDEEENEVMSLFQEEKDISDVIRNLHHEAGTDEKSKILLSQLDSGFKDLRDHELLLDNNKNLFKENKSKFMDFYHKLRGIKTAENDLFFNELMKQADDIGVLSDTFQQCDNYIRGRHKYNCELPFDPSNNIVIMPL
jgi:hypothetical protein